jgi:CDP-paratose 2-epimerase
MIEAATGRPMAIRYTEEQRIGDHRWWISDVRKFRASYPHWSPTFDIAALLADIHCGLSQRLAPSPG